ncbi:unnamed protein product [Spirodela intermedia]|uniref:Uncharacterized protein n=1 Tax=Spirodela intermedia TaxID=51605 RepID=A0A7I8IVE8_SPIIN|nr:unnamed protein product [Spirodela intermedia]CAA6661966.1 unnamed protein product [Spirodela intermedia]
MGKPSPRSHQVHRRRRVLLLFIVVSLAALLLYSYCNSLLPFSSLAESSSRLISVHREPGVLSVNFTFTVKVLAFDRIESLRRCLRSLSGADYGGDRVNLHVFVDHFRTVAPGNDSDLLDHMLQEARRILQFVDGFSWQYGEKMLHYRTSNAGLQTQWLEAWWPGSDDEFAFVVEDDLEVSPLYYKFLKRLIINYYYDSSNFSPSIYGVSLQRPRFVPGKHGNKLRLDNETSLFLYQLVGTWGQLLFPKPWKEFRLWYDEHKSKGIPPILEGMVTNGWYKKMGEKIWTPWFIKFIHSRGYFNIYTHFSEERALSISYRDPGVNYGRSAGPDSVLIDRSSINLNLWETRPLKSLKWYDFCFREVHPGRVMRTLDELGLLLDSLHKQGTVIIVSLFRTPRNIARNLLCHFERLNITNYILLGDSSEFLLDLARTGHPVVDSVQLLSSFKHRDWSHLPNLETGLVTEFSLKAYVIKKSLESGYNTWLVGGDMVPITNAFNETMGSSVDFWASSGTELFYGRSSPTSAKTWNDIIPTSWLHTDPPGSGKILTDESPVFNVAALGGVSNTNASSLLKKGKKVIHWAPGTSTDALLGSLMNMGVWLINGDSSCTAVYCHHS